MTRNLTTLLLVAGCWLLVGCRTNSSGWPVIWGLNNGQTSAAPLPSGNSAMTPQLMPSVSSVQFQVSRKSAAYDPMAPVSYKPMSVVITPNLPPCPPLHWEASPGWGGLVISGPYLDLLDWNHTGCPQHPNVCTARAWLTETTDYVLPVHASGTEFARIIPFETE